MAALFLVGAGASNAVDGEYNVLVDLLVHRELAGLAEGPRASVEVALERLLLRVDVRMFFEVLRQSEGFEAESAHVLLDGRV